LDLGSVLYTAGINRYSTGREFAELGL